MLFAPLRHQRQPIGVLLVGLAGALAIAPTDLRLYETVAQLLSDAITRARLYEEARAMINDILDFSKMEAGHFSVDLYPVDLASVIRSVAGAMRPQIHQRGLSLALELPDDLPLVQANSTRLSQVLTNLVANAVKFTDEGTITVRAEPLAERVRISVQDTGIGIAPDDQRTLFQAFHQIDNQLTRRYGGTGLGLAISRRLLELMDANLTVESALGAGATFSCELRKAQEAALREVAVAE
jgi:signal transduction histidine kinase